MSTAPTTYTIYERLKEIKKFIRNYDEEKYITPFINAMNNYERGRISSKEFNAKFDKLVNNLSMKYVHEIFKTSIPASNFDEIKFDKNLSKDILRSFLKSPLNKNYDEFEYIIGSKGIRRIVIIVYPVQKFPYKNIHNRITRIGEKINNKTISLQTKTLDKLKLDINEIFNDLYIIIHEDVKKEYFEEIVRKMSNIERNLNFDKSMKELEIAEKELQDLKKRRELQKSKKTGTLRPLTPIALTTQGREVLKAKREILLKELILVESFYRELFLYWSNGKLKLSNPRT
jgi:hypothetical protein